MASERVSLESTTVSAKVPSRLREKLRKYDVDVSATVRKALAEELSRREIDESRHHWKECTIHSATR